VVVHVCNPSTWETEARELWVPGHPGLYIARWCLYPLPTPEKPVIH
jgi:hypothetical protein